MWGGVDEAEVQCSLLVKLELRVLNLQSSNIINCLKHNSGTTEGSAVSLYVFLIHK